MTPYQEAKLGKAMLRRAHAEGHFGKLPPDTAINHSGWGTRMEQDALARINIMECLEAAEWPLKAPVIATRIGHGFARVLRGLEILEQKGAVRHVTHGKGYGWELRQPLNALPRSSKP